METRVRSHEGNGVVVVSTPPPVRLGRAAPPHGRPSPHPSTADQRERRSAAPTGSSQRDRIVSVVCMRCQVKRWFILYVCALQSGHIGVGCVSG